MDFITIKNISIYAYHGLLPEERERGQEFLISVKIEANFAGISATDNIQETINYAYVVEEIQTIFTSNNFNLIETLAEKIANHLLDIYQQIEGIEITVEKPRPPLPSITQGVAVTVYRSRK